MVVLLLSRAETESLLDLDALRHSLRGAMEDVTAGAGRCLHGSLRWCPAEDCWLRCRPTFPRVRGWLRSW